jgi:hypothetical protein
MIVQLHASAIEINDMQHVHCKNYWTWWQMGAIAK